MQGKTIRRGIVTNEYMPVNDMPKGAYIVKVNGKNGNNAVKVL